MPAKRFEWLQRIKDVEREHTATKVAVQHFLALAAHDPSVVTGTARLRDVVHARQRLESTYLIRLFAEFETGLRRYWIATRNTEPPKTRDLLESVAARRAVPNDDLLNAHAIRDYRKLLVHERDEPATPIPLAMARGFLCKFFARLPIDW